MKSITNFKMNSNAAKKLKKYILTITTLSTLITMSGCNNKKDLEEKTITQVIEEKQDNTYLDEIMEEKNITFNEVDTLISYINLSKKLHKMEFYRGEIDEEKLKEMKLYSPEEIEQLITDYKEQQKNSTNIDVELDTIKNLNYQEALINKYIYEQGYKITETLFIVIGKSKIIDATMLSEKDYNDITILGSDYSNVNNPSSELFVGFKVNDEIIKAKHGDFMYDFANRLYYHQDNCNSNIPFKERIKYNEDRNKYLLESINMAKDMIKADVKLEEDKFFIFIDNGYKIKTKKTR